MTHRKAICVKSRHNNGAPGPELPVAIRRPSGAAALRAAQDKTVFLLCDRSALSTAIPRRFPSSLLPPSFAAGHRTAAFTRPAGQSAGWVQRAAA